MKAVITGCRDEDVPMLQGLFRKVYPSNPRLQERDYFDWQNRSSPFIQKEGYTFLVHWEDSSIVGWLGYLPVEFKYGRGVFEGCWTHNWYSAGGNVSGIALLSKLTAEFDHRFHIGLSPNSEQIYRSYRIPLLSRLPRWIGILDADRTSALFHVESQPDLEAINSSAGRLNAHRGSAGISNCIRFDPEEEFMFEAWPGILGYCRRTGRYLNWRYFDIPRHNYQAIRDEDGHFAVYRHETIKGHAESVIRILEWTFPGKACERALAAIVREGRAKGAILADFFCTSGEVGGELAKGGFLRETGLTTVIPYLFRPVHQADGIRVAIDMPPHRKERRVNFGEWYITKGDSDIDRVKL